MAVADPGDNAIDIFDASGQYQRQITGSAGGVLKAPERVRVRDADVALLQRVPMLRPLPTVTIEQLAAGMSRAELLEGVAVFEQGDHGDDFYVIEQGEADVVGDGQSIRTLGPGDGSVRSPCCADADAPHRCEQPRR